MSGEQCAAQLESFMQSQIHFLNLNVTLEKIERFSIGQFNKAVPSFRNRLREYVKAGRKTF